MNEWISLSVLPGAKVQFPVGRINSRDFLADHTLSTRPEPAWQKMARVSLNDTAQPVDSEEEGQRSNMDRQRPKKIDSSFATEYGVKPFELTYNTQDIFPDQRFPPCKAYSIHTFLNKQLSQVRNLCAR